MGTHCVAKWVLAAVIAMAGYSQSAIAAEESEKLEAVKIADFPAYRAAIEKEVAGSEKYAEITPESRRRALLLLAQMDELIARTGNVDTLPPVQQIEVFNRQEELNQILSQAAEDSRVICQRERLTGSKLPVHNCLTLAERRRTRDGGRKMLEDLVPTQQKALAR